MWSHSLLRIFFFLIVFFLPAYSYAAVSISEIMYDPSGANSVGSHFRDWIEVYNDGSAVDLSEWKLSEGGVNHGITAYTGGATLNSGSYAVLVDDPALFLADWPNFSGQIFDTAFTGGLNNSNGETLILKNESLSDVDTVTYNPSLGAGGDGNSLQKVGSSFTVVSPTPGASASGVTTPQTTGSTDTSTTTDTTQTTSSGAIASGSSYPVEPHMTVSAGSDRVVVAGAATIFSARALGLTGDAISNARFLWSFGNGESQEGPSVLYAFPYPGKYAVVVDASSGLLSAVARFSVTVVPAEVSVTKVTSEYVEVTNHSKIELNLGLWQLSADGKVFRFPSNTIVFPNESVLISNTATGLTPSAPSAVTLLYPNGTLAAAYGVELILARTSAQAVSVGVSHTASAPAMQNAQNKLVQNLVAAPIAATNPISIPGGFSPPGILPWIIGLVAVVGIGITATLLIRGDKGTETGYTIIEDES